jgi:SAM-dependent MidA family methyltransferase
LQIGHVIRERGPLTVAAFMELALYDPEFGYYARAAQRSGRAGDFFTSVDVGATFGELIEVQLAQMADLLAGAGTRGQRPPQARPAFDLVEAGAGNGRLSADILRAARARHPAFFESIQLHLTEASAPARAQHPRVLGELASRLQSSGPALPPSFEGVLLANELLDALPVHQVVMREDGLREVYVDVEPRATDRAGALRLVEGRPSTPRLQEYLDRAAITLGPGWRTEINLRAVDWIHEAAARLRRGFLIVIDYGHVARDLYSESHSAGTLTTFAGHQAAGPERPGRPAWLERPGERDITAHVDFTSARRAGEDAGLTVLALLDQTYFLLGIMSSTGRWRSPGFATADVRRRLALKTLLLPGGLGSTHKVLIFGKGVGAPRLVGCAQGGRLT